MKIILNHPQLGPVHVTFRRDSRSISLRHKSGSFHSTAPYGLSHAELMTVFDRLAPKALDSLPTLFYNEGDTIDTGNLLITISRQNMFADKIAISDRGHGMVAIAVGNALEMASESTTSLITKSLKSIASRHAPDILLPRAESIARSLNQSPSRWAIGHGDRRLGCCNSRREISLSRICIYLDEQLRDYIICHELAHLSEMNHSPRFHDVCDGYCRAVIGRPERELASALKAYRWPIIL